MRIAKIITTGALVGALGFASPLGAQQEEPPIQEMDQLIQQGNHQQAYELASENLAAWEGNTEFDLLYGMAAIEAGYPNEAVFALERVANTAPNRTTRQRARLELARAHFMTNNLAASENLFRQVLDSDPPQNVQDNVNVFLDLIAQRRQEQRTTTTFDVAALGGYDDNINSSTDSTLIDTPLIGQVELNPEGRQTSDEFTDFQAEVNHRRPLTRDLVVEANANLSSRDNRSTDQFDLDTLRGSLTLRQTAGNHRFGYGLRTQKVWLAGDAFQQSAGLNLSWQRAGSDGWYQSLNGSATAVRYDNTSASPRNDLRDVNRTMVSGGLIHVGSELTNSFNAFYAREEALRSAGEHNGRRFYGLAHNLTWQLGGGHAPYTRLSAQDVRHDARHPVFFNSTRDETVLNGALGWDWQYSDQLSVSGEAMYMRSDSNIELFDYSRLRLQAELRYQFSF